MGHGFTTGASGAWPARVVAGRTGGLLEACEPPAGVEHAETAAEDSAAGARDTSAAVSSEEERAMRGGFTGGALLPMVTTAGESTRKPMGTVAFSDSENEVSCSGGRGGVGDGDPLATDARGDLTILVQAGDRLSGCEHGSHNTMKRYYRINI